MSRKNTYSLSVGGKIVDSGLHYSDAVKNRGKLMEKGKKVVIMSERTGDVIRLGAPTREVTRDVLRRVRMNEEEWSIILNGARLEHEVALRTNPDAKPLQITTWMRQVAVERAKELLKQVETEETPLPAEAGVGG